MVRQISGMEISVNSIIKKPFSSRNCDEKLEIAKAEKPTLKLDISSSKLGRFKKCFMLVRVIALNFRALPHLCFINACIRQQILWRSTPIKNAYRTPLDLTNSLIMVFI